MATDPRAALDRLVEALQAHLAAAQRRKGDEDPAVEAAYRALADAFEVYDEALYAAHDEVTPFMLYDEDEESEDDDADEADDGEDDDADEDEDLDELEDEDDESVPDAAGTVRP